MRGHTRAEHMHRDSGPYDDWEKESIVRVFKFIRPDVGMNAEIGLPLLFYASIGEGSFKAR